MELSVGPSAASPGNGSTVLAIDVWEHVSVRDGSSWPSLEVDSGGSGNESKEEFHFLIFIIINLLKD